VTFAYPFTRKSLIIPRWQRQNSIYQDNSQ
jgi:hypothetical protein